MKANGLFSIVAMLALCVALTSFQAQAQQPGTLSNTAKGSVQLGDETWLSNLMAQAQPRSRASFSLMAASSDARVSMPVFKINLAAAGPSLTVMGSGTLGRLTERTGFTSSILFIGDTTIFEDKLGKVGIGTDSPTSSLTVAGVIESNPAVNASSPSFSIKPMAAGPNLTVLGGGTLGRLTKWTGFTSSNSFIGDSTIFEDKFGMVGIGTDTPTSKLTVAGMIQSMGGGLKFPDGTVQTTSASGALLTVQHDSTLTGGGTQASPLGVASPLEVRDLDNPARQPVQVHTGCSTQAALCEIVIYNVPANKRLVIEYASMAGAIGTGQVALFDLETTLSGNDVVHAVQMSQPATAFGKVRVGQQVRIYADPGTNVIVSSRCQTGGAFEYSISGHLVDIP